ncbi:MAG: hypothetical protein KAQ67_08755 [Gammaproteobacteria bacterium]|nr:hypothetical protein [Gammaproteobacteria bacterium]
MHTRCWQLTSVIISGIASFNAISEEINAFKLTDFSGELALRYLYDEQIVSDLGVETKNDVRPTFQEELKLSSSSYIYHPNLLKMDISGSLLLDQSSYESIGSETSTEKELINLNARFNFLKKKPYPVSIYYNKQNPSITTGVDGRFIQENIRYGIDASVMQPVSPVLVSLKAYHQTLQGESADQIVDDDKKQATLRLYLAPAPGAHMELTHQDSQQVSSSGSPNLPIIERETGRTQTNFSSRDVFGSNKGIQLTTTLSRKTQDQYPVIDELSFSPSLNWKHNKKLNSFYRLNIVDSTEEDLDKDVKKLDTGVTYRSVLMNTGLSLRAEDNVTSNVDSSLIGLKYNYSYTKPVAVGKIKFNFNSLYDIRDQVTDVALADVYGESIVLDGIALVNLSRNYIDTLTIVVSNESRTQVYVEDIDYRITVVGVQTRIERVIGGNILDGQTVLVDYSYQTGGTFAYDMATNNINVNWSILKSYDVYMRYRETDIDLQEGTPSITLNSVTSVTVGMRANKPLLNGIKIGGDIYQENREEDISPFIKQNVEAYLEMPLPQLTNIRISTRRVIQDNEYSDEDVDSEELTIRIKSRPWLRGSMSWESSYKNDVGGTTPRLTLRHRLRLSWKIRQLAVGAAINYRKEQQGDDRSERWDARITASRKF